MDLLGLLTALVFLLAVATAPLALRYFFDLDSATQARVAQQRALLHSRTVQLAELESRLASGEWIPKEQHEALKARCVALAGEVMHRSAEKAFAALDAGAVNASYARGFAAGQADALKRCPSTDAAFQRGLEAGGLSCPTCAACPVLIASAAATTAVPRSRFPPVGTQSADTQPPLHPQSLLQPRRVDTHAPLRGTTRRAAAAAAATPPPPPPAQDDEYAEEEEAAAASALPRPQVRCEDTYDFGTDRLGAPTLAEVSTSSGLRCKRTCALREDCAAWAFTSGTGVCRLLSQPGRAVDSAAAISGIHC